MLPRVDIEKFGPATGVAPLSVAVIAVVAPDTKDLKKVGWCYRRGGGGWHTAAAVDILEPTTFVSYTYKFDLPGQYEIAVEAFNSNGVRLSAARTVNVIDPAGAEGRIQVLEFKVRELEDRMERAEGGITAAMIAAPVAAVAADNVAAPPAPKKRGRPRKVVNG